MTVRKLPPQPSAPRPAAKQSISPRPSVSAPAPAPKASAPSAAPSAQLQARTGRTSSFEAFRPPAVVIDRPGHGRNPHCDSTGRGTNDDSVGRGTNDDSVGRGTNDDSVGRGTNDDSIGNLEGPDGRRSDGEVGGGRHGIGGLIDKLGGKLGELIDRLRPGVPDAARAGLSPETAAKMESLTSPSNRDVAYQASYVFNTKEFQALPAAEREKIVNVMDAGGVQAARGMAEMFEQSGGAMLQAKGSDGTTVLDSLDRLAGSDHKDLVGNVMYDLVNPGRIWQGRAPTCTVSTMQYELAQSDPGEYARLITGLACDGKVTMRGGGELTTDVAWALSASSARGDMRSQTEAIFQAAAMEFANGADTYLEYSQQSVGSDSYRGLRGEQISTMIGQLFGVKYETLEITSDAQADAELNEIMARERPNRPVLFDITVDGQQSNHCVSLEEVKNGRVYYRDPTTGERESMSVAEFRERLCAVHYAPAASLSTVVSGVVGRFKDLFAKIV